MGEVSKSNEVICEGDVSDGIKYLDEHIAQAKAEKIFNDVYKILAAGKEAEARGAIRFRIKEPPVVEKVISKIFDCIYMYDGFNQIEIEWFDKEGVQSAKTALAEVQKILSSLDAIPKTSMERFLNQVPKRGSIFGKSWRRSAENFADHCAKKIAGAQKSRGRPANDRIDFITQEVVDIFEFWVGRKFKKTTALAKGKDSERGDFLGLDAVCVHSILKGIDPKINISRVKTALNKIPPRSRKGSETF